MPPRKKAAPKVDETVVNQENPGSSTKDRETTDTDSTDAPVAEMAPANEVDDTVKNQESLGSAEVKDRSPDPVLVEDSSGVVRDLSNSAPEIVDPNADEEEKRKNRLRQTEAALDAKDIDGPEDEEKREETPKITIEFLESGLTTQRRVWKAGQILELEDNDQTRQTNTDADGKVWYELSSKEQEDRYGKVYFEKR